ncbi:hypothetical protein COW36_18650 [bacterium (Candidatus Blackallbacteria) CG17_big_fil_post_rev_8_21_14_2_50_48_46]|uniref:SseB protein N-terminal domain-containing protein n=1 Tax=bacterium (Candidatus Blackallbacteria) CG17_big_fil_post_rev_8_21_14_2_50_48_46 TaxID=2014261 RepID=A0A2M7G151_9BACT|nr:MAG: hypothetical protein COW64_00085 [bacterium (Candidatus Blackallbacteria) CG18_big_fil_WC_8_21_14_2_50_49_26]PIW15434.1 MAG: hypothetical protein COW36_18650 [bacterium (Candidatus Blackallbacteria) CG17_big_fil_post_rev_8_21_14_2_50_48_46]PIW49705.1 MAG: hypothetical protein COW20_04715 [bacterium (Candidatus Blackallbacteria) CG13_big_fil_rev_8_21_14_2_50_49_14]
MTVQTPFQDLTDALTVAKRGLKKDVEGLVNLLPEGGFYFSLARSLGLPDHETAPAPEAAVSSHMLQHPEGGVYVALFTRAEFARKAQAEQGWLADSGKAEVCPLPARNALYYTMQLILNNEQVIGALVNAYQDNAIELNIMELKSLFEGVPVPFEGYAHNVPYEEGESIMIRLADMSDVPGFTNTVQGFLSANPGIKHYEMVALFDEQRNMQPYLAINFHTEMPETQYGEIAAGFVKYLRENLDLPERLEVMFNQEFPGLI